MATIPEGYALVAGRSRETAQKVLAAAEKAGVDATTVRTSPEGYLVPTAVLDALEGDEKSSASKKTPAKSPTTRKATAKKASAVDPEAEPASKEKE